MAPDKRGIHIIVILFLHENICCGYSLEVPRRGASHEYQQHMFHEEIRKISVLSVLKSAWAYAVLQYPIYSKYLEILTANQHPKISNPLIPTIWPKLCFLCSCFLKYLVEWQTVKTLIRLLLQEQSDLGLHCSICDFVRNFGVLNFRTFTVPDITTTLSDFLSMCFKTAGWVPNSDNPNLFSTLYGSTLFAQAYLSNF